MSAAPQKRLVRRASAWVFGIAWNASLAGWLVGLLLVYRPSGPSDNPLDLARGLGTAVELVFVGHGWALALLCYALLASAAFRRLVFEPGVTIAQVRGPLWGCALLWTVLPLIVVLHLLLF